MLGERVFHRINLHVFVQPTYHQAKAINARVPSYHQAEVVNTRVWIYISDTIRSILSQVLIRVRYSRDIQRIEVMNETR